MTDNLDVLPSRRVAQRKDCRHGSGNDERLEKARAAPQGRAERANGSAVKDER